MSDTDDDDVLYSCMSAVSLSATTLITLLTDATKHKRRKHRVTVDNEILASS